MQNIWEESIKDILLTAWPLLGQDFWTALGLLVRQTKILLEAPQQVVWMTSVSSLDFLLTWRPLSPSVLRALPCPHLYWAYSESACYLFNSYYLKEHSAPNLHLDIRTFITHRMIFIHFGSQPQVLVPPAFLYSLGLTSYTRTFLSPSLLSIRPRVYFVLWGKGRFTVFLVPHSSS